MSTAVLNPIEQFLALPDDERVIRELDQGEVREMAPPQRIHSIVGLSIGVLLRQIFPLQSGSTVGQTAGFELGEDCLRIPDVFVINRKRFERMPCIRGWYQGAPDIAVEVVSPNDSARDLDRKIHQFLRAGAQSVWAVYPEARHVVVHRGDGSILDYREGDSIQAPDLPADASIAVNAVFEGV